MTPNNGGGEVMILPSEKGSAAEVGGGGGGGHVAEGKALKKGPWTAAEDQILMEYVRKHGEGNWNSVQRNSGLNRCGKSCRLRWANHLRPNLRKGSFSPEEERLILELHAKYGNKWARMASQLPGRTDNEIKNYWNTRVKRRQRQGLPLYPHDIQQSGINSQQQSHSQQPTSLTPTTTTTTTNPSFCFQIQNPTSHSHQLPPLSPTPPQSLSPISSPHHPKPNALPPLSLFDPTTSSFSSFSSSSSSPSFTFHLPTPLRHKRYRDSVGFSPPINPTPQTSSVHRTSSMPDNASFQFAPSPASLMSDIASVKFPRNNFNSPFPPMNRNQFEYSDSMVSPTGSGYSFKSELPSSQVSQTQSEITIDTKVSSMRGGDETHGNSGLLEDLLQEAEASFACGGSNSRSSGGIGLSGVFEDQKRVLDGYGRWLQASNSSLDTSSCLEAKPLQDDSVNYSMPEDLSKLFSFIPSTGPVSDWYSTDSGDQLSNGTHSSGLTDAASLEFEMQQHMTSFFPVAVSTENGTASDSWDNLPGMC